MSDYRHLLDYLRQLEEKIEELNQFEIVYCISVDTHFLKLNAVKEIQEWRASIARVLKTQSSGSLKEIMDFLDEQGKVLATPAKDVESAKKILVSLDLIRDKEVDVDSLISPIEVCLKENSRISVVRFHCDLDRKLFIPFKASEYPSQKLK